MDLSSMNQTTNYGIHPCYILDLTNHPTSNPSKQPTNNPSNSPTNNPSNFPSYYPSNIPSKYPSDDPTNNPSKYPSYTPTPDPTSVHFLTTSILKHSPTDQVSIVSNGGFAKDSASTYAIISILSLLLVVCSVGVILLFCIYKKKDNHEDTCGITGMEFDGGRDNNIEHRPSAPILQEAQEDTYCLLCCERKANMFNDPCGHVTYCNKCSSVNAD
eukprot:576322_1